MRTSYFRIQRLSSSSSRRCVVQAKPSNVAYQGLLAWPAAKASWYKPSKPSWYHSRYHRFAFLYSTRFMAQLHCFACHLRHSLSDQIDRHYFRSMREFLEIDCTITGEHDDYYRMRNHKKGREGKRQDKKESLFKSKH